MVQFHKLTNDHPDFALVQKIRQIVFVGEQKVNVSDEYDAFEQLASHYSSKKTTFQLGCQI